MKASGIQNTRAYVFVAITYVLMAHCDTDATLSGADPGYGL